MKSKRIVSLLILTLIIMTLGSTALASEKGPEVLQSQYIVFSINNEGEAVVHNLNGQGNMVLINSSEDSISPNTTVPGNIGTATFKWINARQVYWRVNPYNSSHHVYFSGKIVIKNLETQKIARTIYVSDSGVGQASGNEFFSRLATGMYIGELTGSGTSGGKAYTVPSVEEVRYIY